MQKPDKKAERKEEGVTQLIYRFSQYLMKVVYRKSTILSIYQNIKNEEIQIYIKIIVLFINILRFYKKKIIFNFITKNIE
jgi:hypothetical protein